MYTINGQGNGRIFPCVFALLPNKNENTYNRLFEQLFELVNNLGNSPNDVWLILKEVQSTHFKIKT